MPLFDLIVGGIIESVGADIWPSPCREFDEQRQVIMLMLWSSMSHSIEPERWWQGLESSFDERRILEHADVLILIISEAIKEKQDDFRRAATSIAMNGSQGRTEESGFWPIVNLIKNTCLFAFPVLALQFGDATGDMFALAASLVLSQHSWLLVYPVKGRPGHIRHIVDFYNASGLEERVSTLDTEGTNATITTKALELCRSNGVIYWVSDIDFGTRFLAEVPWTSNSLHRRTIREAWQTTGITRSNKLSEMAAWLQNSRGLPIEQMRDAPLVVLWSRFSGKKGEIHIEHDTSYQGMRQLVKQALAAGIQYVVLAGDKPLLHPGLEEQQREARMQKYQMISTAMSGRVFDLTGFWADEDARQLQLNRLDQFLLYELFHRLCRTKHLGFRSGNLEAMALLGYTVRYLEEEQSWGGSRMERWHGIGLGYERIGVSRVPTRTGQFVVKTFKGKAKIPPDLKWAPINRLSAQYKSAERTKLKEQAQENILKKQSAIKGQNPEVAKKKIMEGELKKLQADLEKQEKRWLAEGKPREVQEFEKGFDIIDLEAIGRYFAADIPYERMDTDLPFL